jgi:hypothetical protein
MIWPILQRRLVIFREANRAEEAKRILEAAGISSVLDQSEILEQQNGSPRYRQTGIAMRITQNTR